jgi:hypothetical protein
MEKEQNKKINGMIIDLHLYRRMFHTAGASLLIYYLLPNRGILGGVKIFIPIFIIICVLFLEYFRIKGKVKPNRFFRLRPYEEKRPASYIYFGVGMLLLFLFFPQQIAIPCILCACFSDPIMGELKRYLAQKNAYIIGFFVCMFFFLATWYKAELWIVLLVSIIGGFGALIGEVKKIWFIDDDFMIQMLPASFLLIIWYVLKIVNLEILPPKILFPIG